MGYTEREEARERDGVARVTVATEIEPNLWCLHFYNMYNELIGWRHRVSGESIEARKDEYGRVFRRPLGVPLEVAGEKASMEG